MSVAHATNHGEEAARFEQARNYRMAKQLYQRAVDELKRSIEATLVAGSVPAASAAALHWMLGSARLDLARTWVLSGFTQEASESERAKFMAILHAAKQDLLVALQAEASGTAAAGGRPSERTAMIRNALAWQAVLEGDAVAAEAEARQAREASTNHPYAASLDRAILALSSTAKGSDAMSRRTSVRPTAELPDEAIVALKSVIDIGSFFAAAAPDLATAATMRGAAAAPALATTASMRALDACPSAFTGTCYPVWFGTNRKPIDPSDPQKGFSGDYDDQIRFGKRIVFIPKGHRPGELGSPLWKRLLAGRDDRIEVGPSRSLSEQAFAAEIREVLGTFDPADRHVLVFIHGYRTSFDTASRHAAQLGFDLKVPGITLLYSWPSRGGVSDYVADVESIEASEEHIAQFLVMAAALADRGQVHIIAHSMGNRGLLRAMHRASAQAAITSGVRFGKIFLAAPDVDPKLFRQLASIYPKISERTTLYVADQDKAIAASEWLTKEPRAGSVPPLVIVPGIDTIRVRGAGLFRLGHDFVASDVNVLRDISTLLYGKDPPGPRGQRNGWPILDRAGSGVWVIGDE